MLIVLKSGSPTFLEPSGPVQTCLGTALPFYLLILWEASHMLYSKYEGPNTYVGHPLYIQNEAHNIS